MHNVHVKWRHMAGKPEKKYPVTAEWLERARRARTRHRYTMAALADEVGVSQSAVSRLLAGDHTVSALVPDVSSVLGIDPPESAMLGEEETLLLELYRRLGSAEQETVRTLIQQLLNKTK